MYGIYVRLCIEFGLHSLGPLSPHCVPWNTSSTKERGRRFPNKLGNREPLSASLGVSQEQLYWKGSDRPSCVDTRSVLLCPEFPI